MRDTRRTRIWALAGAFAFALAAGAASKRTQARREAAIAAAPGPAGEDLRDAVASPMRPAVAALAGKPVPTTWFKTPEQHRAEMDSALLSSRHRRALARRVAVQ